MLAKNYLINDLEVTTVTNPFKTTKVSFLWVLVKGVQWSFKVGIVELLRGSWTREVGDGLSYDFKLGCQPGSKEVRVGA